MMRLWRALPDSARAVLILGTLAGHGATAEVASHIDCTLSWARATTSDAPTGAVYATLTNAGDQDRQLVSASAPVADHVELHVHRIDQAGVMHMDQMPALTIPAHGSLVLAPGGAHLMLIGLHHGLVSGQDIELTLVFSDGSRTITAHVASAGARGPGE